VSGRLAGLAAGLMAGSVASWPDSALIPCFIGTLGSDIPRTMLQMRSVPDVVAAPSFLPITVQPAQMSKRQFAPNATRLTSPVRIHSFRTAHVVCDCLSVCINEVYMYVSRTLIVTSFSIV
jgi:hypothetical protein